MIAIDPTGRFLYESHYNKNIYAFAIASDGSLSSLGSVGTLPTSALAALAL